MDNYKGKALHTISPYVGKIRPELARNLVEQYTKKGDRIWDPFCGSGTIPLEAKLLERHVVASDVNPYACVIARAKLHAPTTKEQALNRLYKFISQESVPTYLANHQYKGQTSSQLHDSKHLTSSLYHEELC